MDYVTDMAAKRAEIEPDAPAFRDVETGRILTFAAFNERADRCANGLIAGGAKPGDRIGVLTLNRVEFFEILFACQKAELIMVPLNWRQPALELEPVVRQSGTSILIYDTDMAATAATLVNDLQLEDIGIECAGAETNYEAMLAAASPEPAGGGRRKASDLWYLLFTSGTTGLPKAVIQTFGMAWANTVNICQATGLNRHDTTANFLPLFHTAGINLHTVPLFLLGGYSHVLRKFEPDQLFEMIEAGDISVLFGVPAIYQAFSLHPRFAEVDFSNVRQWACGGAPLPENLIHLFAEKGAVVCNGFGMTETGPTVFLVDEANAVEKIGSVGKAQILAEARICDDDNRLVEQGQSGELQVRGPGITPGYFGNDEATAKAFAEGGWLHTGDVARQDADGYYYIVDRIKDMYISGGENVYPAEVERVLNSHPDVLEAAVLGVPDDKWGEVGRAYLLPRPGHTVDVDALKPWCRERLAAYKVPKSFRVVDDYPRTAAGKVQKHILRASDDD